ncbi:MAG: hypothetical protein ACI86H_002590, partial [bacterium]
RVFFLITHKEAKEELKNKRSKMLRHRNYN